MKRIRLNEECVDFERKSKELVGRTLKNVFYSNNVEGFLNTRARGEMRFDYIPMSKMFFETVEGVIYKFFDSSTFLNHYGFYTLDLMAIGELNLRNEVRQSDSALWSPYIGAEIKEVVIDWQSLHYQHYKEDPPDVFPKGMRVLFSNGLHIVVVASELDLLRNGEYKFMCPDEALIVCFSKETYDEFFGKLS